MGMSMGNAGGGGGKRRRSKRHMPVSEINVTPFVDVMLVLLIIFMVAAPLLTVGVPIDLPETQAKSLQPETQPITISVNQEGRVYIQESEISADDILAQLEAIAQNGYEERIYVRGDRTADYGTVMKIMARISAAGYKKIGLVTLQEQGQ